LLLELDSFYNKKKSYFFGYVRMSKKKGKWLVIGPFKSKEDYWLDEYVKRYIPGEFKGLSESLKKKKFTPPPIQKLSSKKAPQEEDIIATEKTAPPGDSIDADEFIVQQANKKKSNPVKPISAKSKAVVTPPTNPEANKFLAGDYSVQGNYTSLLTKIRKHFPNNASTSILLIDKSRRTLYLYNEQNLLLAFFPILSSDNSSFLSGLYRVNPDKPVKSAKDTSQQRSQPILLQRMLRQNSKDNPLFYIRDLLDTDTKNSLQLSPIDNKKLQLLLLNPSIAYIGQ
jgi:hypothetical protein